jgi:F-type H+-transporting ATPase subunit alpha
LRLDLASYRELQAFALFASDLDEHSRHQLERGERMVEILKQPPYSPVPVEKQVISIFAGTKGYLDDIPVAAIGKFEQELGLFIDTKHASILDTIRTSKKIDDSTEEELRNALEDFKKQFSA